MMSLGEFKTCFGETLRHFECPACGNARDSGLVRAERKASRYGTQVEEICREAIRWAETRKRDRYVWDSLDQRPDIAPVMVRMLAEKGPKFCDLADAVVKKYGVEAPSPGLSATAAHRREKHNETH